MSPLARCVGRTIRGRALLGERDRVLVAISGGADSVALTWLLRDLSQRSRWRLVGLVHVHHGLRGEDADGDEAFCRALAARLALPIEVIHADARAQARVGRQSLESAARAVRYAGFDAALGHLDATTIVTGHTADDQAETVLMRLLRGAGARGISAIRWRRGAYVRPLLDVRRAQLRADLDARGESFREDASNADVSIPRNRLRHDVLPALERAFAGSVRALSRAAELASADEALLSALARDAGAGLAMSDASGVQLDRAALGALPPALARRVVRDAIESQGGLVSLRHVDAIRRLAAAHGADWHLDLPRLAVDRRGRHVQMRPRAAAGDAAPGFAYTLPIPGAIWLPETGMTIEASYQESVDVASGFERHPHRALLQAASVAAPLVVRSRRPGDWFRPLGAPGRRKLQDVLVDRKIPRHRRDAVPVVVDAAGRILWVAGVTMADECRVTAPESGVVILELKKGIQ